MRDYTISCKGHSLSLGRNTCIMGVLNVTPDSFSDGGDYLQYSNAVERALQMVSEGADIIDIGGESSRPFAEPVSEEEEIRRVVPVIRELSSHLSVPISIDTVKSSVAEEAVKAGASIINDISALTKDEKMAEVAAEYQVPVILMHMQGNPETMQLNPSYENPVQEIIDYLQWAIDNAVKNNIPRNKIIVDPGIGFGKTKEHNLAILNNLSAFSVLDAPVLSGPSRKTFIRTILGANDIKKDIDRIETGTQAAVAASVLGGAHIVRVHDVASTADTVKILDAIKNSN